MEFNFKNLNSDLAAQIATYIKLSLKKKNAKQKGFRLWSSVPNPWHFDTDPDHAFSASELQLFKAPTKHIYFIVDPDPY